MSVSITGASASQGERCPGAPERLQTAKGAKKRAEKGWNAKTGDKDKNAIKQVRTQARCAPTQTGRKSVKLQISAARKAYGDALKVQLYEKLISPPGGNLLAYIRNREAGGCYTCYSTGAYGWINQSASNDAWDLTESKYKSTKWHKLHDPAAPCPTCGSNEQQDIRAAILYQMYGGSPWPYLKEMK